MPKKFQGENTKSAEARARKAAQKNAEREQKEKAAEDAYWADDDKHVAKKQQRKDERETKRVEQLQKKKELQELHDKEMAALPGRSGSAAAAGVAARSAAAASSSKVTRAEIEAYRQRMATEAEAKAKAEQGSTVVVDEVPLEENVNRLAIDGDEARTVDEALRVLSSDGDADDKHPEKRVRAAWLAYEELNLPRLKLENPNLRLSQLKQLLKKQWQKAPENPFNQL